MIDDLENTINDYKLDQENYELILNERFLELRQMINLQRETLKEKIDQISLEMTDLTKETERDLIEKLKVSYCEII